MSWVYATVEIEGRDHKLAVNKGVVGRAMVDDIMYGYRFDGDFVPQITLHGCRDPEHMKEKMMELMDNGHLSVEAERI